MTGSSGPVRYDDARPVAVPDDVDERRHVKAAGVIELPSNIRWSGPRKTYDLQDRRELRRVYEQVLREGTDDDVRRYIAVDKLAELWDEFVLPRRVRQAWAAWFRRRRSHELSCGA